MKTEQDDLLIERYVGGGMTGEERTGFEHRLASDEALRHRVDIERFMIRSMRGDRAAATAIDHSGARERALGALRTAAEPGNGRRKPVAGWWTRGKLGGLAALLAAGSIGLGVYMKSGNDAPAEQGPLPAPTAPASSAPRAVPPAGVSTPSAVSPAAAPSSETSSSATPSVNLPTRATPRTTEGAGVIGRESRTESRAGNASAPAAVSRRDTVVTTAPHELPSFEEKKAKGKMQVDMDED